MFILQFLGSTAGRWTRATAGIILIVVAIALGGWWWLLALVGVVFITAGAFDFCLLAPLVGKPSRGRKFKASL
jgi:hypothetical protein